MTVLPTAVVLLTLVVAVCVSGLQTSDPSPNHQIKKSFTSLLRRPALPSRHQRPRPDGGRTSNKKTTIAKLLLTSGLLSREHQYNSTKDATTTDTLLNIPPRFMWGWGPGLSGYCGETAFQSHGIFWGNWISSELVRNNADRKELLINVNDEDAANNLHFTFEKFDWEHESQPQYVPFASFVKRHIDEGHLIVAGFFEKMPADDGDSDYDHIMPIIGYQTSSATSSKTSSATVEKSSADGADLPITGIYYNDLYTKGKRFLGLPSGAQTRSQCTQSKTPSQPYDYCVTSKIVHAIALTGIQDVNEETQRMWLTMPDWKEPDWGKEDRLHEQVVSFQVTANIVGLEAGVGYSVLRFDDPIDVPDQGFLNGGFARRFDFVASSSTHKLTSFDTVMSDSSVFYRCVRQNL